MLLTKQFFGKNISFKKVMMFVIGLYYSKKIEELISFLYWEIKYRLSLYPKRQLLCFDNRKALFILGAGDLPGEIAMNGFKISRSRFNWGLVFFDNDRTLWGCLCDQGSVLQHLGTDNRLRSIYGFPDSIKGIFISKAGVIFVCAQGKVFRSEDNGKSFDQVLSFSCHKSFFRHETITESPEADLFIGEYANVWQDLRCRFVGYIYHSSDGGKTWSMSDFLKRSGINKHVHVIRWSTILKALVLTDGDNKKYIWMNRTGKQIDKPASKSGDGWVKINKLHIQKGGYTSFVEAGGTLFLGTDYYGGTNFLVTTSDMKTFNERVIPNPYRRGFLRRMVLRAGGGGVPEIWASLKFNFDRGNKSLLMMSGNLGESWNKVFEYNGNKYGLKIISSSNGGISDTHFILLCEKKTKSKTTYRIHS